MKIECWDKRLADFLKLVKQGEIRINKRYQRSGKVWPLNAKSYLVETVIMHSVLPRLMLHHVPATRSVPEHTDIVDGQQRTTALFEFLNDEYRLSGVVDRGALKNKKYSTLAPADRKAFDDYVLKADRFEQATEQDIRDVFRRINSYTAPLNPEEQRHAKFQGEFKWFINRQMELYADAFQSSAVLTATRVNRMADAKLLTEIVHAMVNGITTTDARTLRKLYADFDREFELDRDFSRRLAACRSRFAEWGELPKPLRKHYHAYSLLLALLHAQELLRPLQPISPRRRKIRPNSIILANFSVLAAVLESVEEGIAPEYLSFYRASAKGTNVKAAREDRFRWFYRALTQDSL